MGSVKGRWRGTPNRALVVLGMHRSGTSAVTGALGLLGADLGPDLLPANAFNEAGYFEHSRILAVHERVLFALGRSWRDLEPLPAGWWMREDIRICRREIVDILRHDFATSPLWAVKDPRHCRLLPLWEGLFDELGCDPAFLLVVRQPREIADSLARRNAMPVWQSHLLFLAHMLAAERQTRGQRRAFLTYDQLITDGAATLGRARDELDLEFRLDAEVAGRLAEFLRPALRHARFSPAADVQAVDRWAERCYDAFAAAAAGATTAATAATLDQLAEGLEAAFALFVPWNQSVEKDLDASARTADLVVTRTHAAALASEIDAARRAHADRDQTEATLRSELHARLEEISAARHYAQDLVRQIENARTVNAELEVRIDAARRAGEDRDRAETALVLQVEAARALSVELAGSLEAARAELALRMAREEDFELALDSVRASAEANRARDLRLDSRLRNSRIGRLFGLHPRPSEAAPRLHQELPEQPLFVLDGPPDQIEGPCFEISGRCAGQGPTRRMRAHGGGQVFSASAGVHRPDVAECHPGIKNAEESGFRLAATLPPGRHVLVFEEDRGDGIWRHLGSRVFTVLEASLRASIDRPASWLQWAGGEIGFAGWCVHPHARIARLSIVVGPVRADCLYGLSRPDVDRHLAGLPGGSTACFQATCRVPPGRHLVALEAELDDGTVLRQTWRRALLAFPRVLPHAVRRAGRAMITGTGLIRFATAGLVSSVRRTRRLPPLGALPRLFSNTVMLYRDRHVQRDLSYTPPPCEDAYARWVAVNQWNDRARCELRERLRRQAERLPGIIVVIPGGAGAPSALETVCKQEHASVEVLVVGGEPPAQIATGRVRWLGHGAVPLATALEGSSPDDMIAFLDGDARLSKDALAEVALACAADPATDLVYGDDDEGDGEVVRRAPRFKPDWSPELLLNEDYLGPFLAVRRGLLDSVSVCLGAMRPLSRDAVLQLAEQARRVAHIPLVLCHRSPRPPSSGEDNATATRAAWQRRRGPARAATASGEDVVVGDELDHELRNDGPRVAVIVWPGRLGALDPCVALSGATYRNKEVWRLCRASEQECSAMGDGCALPIADEVWARGRSAVLNAAAARVDAEYLLFLGSDIEPLRREWLSRLVCYGQLAGVGAVGARLVSADGRLLHAGVAKELPATVRLPLYLAPETEAGHLGYARVTRNVSALDGGCLLTARQAFMDVAGFDVEAFPDALAEVDYCYRLADRGRRTVLVATVELILHRLRNGDDQQDVSARATFKRRHARRPEPYVSPHLSLKDLSVRPRRLASSTQRPVRTLFCSFNLNWEGASFSQFELVRRLAQVGVVDPVVFSPSDGPLRAAYEAQGIRVEVGAHPLSGVATVAAYEAAIARFARFLADNDAEVVFGNTINTFYGIAAAHEGRLPSIWNPRESEAWTWHIRNFAPEIVARALDCFRHPYRVVFVAEATRQAYQPLETAHNFAVIHNGLDLRRLRGASAAWTREEARRSLGVGADDVVLLLVGTVCERKGQVDLVQALARFPLRWHGCVRTFIVGDRGLPYSAVVARALRRVPARLRERTSLVRETDETAPFYRAADVFVCTSRLESFPRVILEAMAYHLPIVTTPVFGIREQVREGVNALFYEPGDTESLARALIRLVEDVPLRRKLADNASPALACLNTYDEMVDAYAVVIREAYLSLGRPIPTP